MKKILLLSIILIISISFLWLWNKEDQEEKVSNFRECLLAGYSVMESYPRQCRTSDGEIFVENIGNELEKMDLIRVATPRPNQKITSPLSIAGQARGYWFFEADFPVKIFDSEDNLLGLSIAVAQGEWMTEDFVAFEANLEFDTSQTERGYLVLERDNPSGLPENDDSLIIPVIFDKARID